MDQAQIDKRFSHHPPTRENVVELHEATRGLVKRCGSALNILLPESREKSLAFTALEEALMWANAAIARNQS